MNHMAAERDLELVDDYLANRMDDKARSAFEQQLAKDPDLKAELELQQQFVNGIKKARIAELKSMLNNVPVPAAQTGGSAVISKIGLWAIAMGIVGTALYLYLTQTPETEPQPTTGAETQQTEKQAPYTSSGQETKQTNDGSPVVSEEETSSEEAASEQPPAESPKATKKRGKKTDAAKDPKIDVFDPTKEGNNDEQPTQEESSPNLPVATPTDIAVEIDSENKKYNFHYQFKEGKLFLYGPFEKNLYEIMEFFGDEKRTLFLFHKDNYYLLKEDNQKLKPLNPIQDPALLKKLKEYRN